MDATKITTLLQSFRPYFLARKPLTVTNKGPSDFVTDMDIWIESKIKETLRTWFPNDTFMGEESSGTLSEKTWILDPIDGTTNFMKDYHQSVISLALAEHHQVTYAWIYHPYLDEIYFAQKGRGSTLNGKPIFVSSASIEQAIFAVGSAPYIRSLSHPTMQIIEKLFTKSLDFRRSGSAAYDLACVASGRVDGFFELDLRTWDFAAGMLLVLEAGGKVSSLDDEELSLFDHQVVIASNGLVHADMVDMIQEVKYR